MILLPLFDSFVCAIDYVVVVVVVGVSMDERQNPLKKRKFMISSVQTLGRIRVEIGFHGG